MISLKTLVNWDQSQLQNLAVEYLNKDNIILYVGDGGTRSIIVYNVLNNKGFRIKLPRSIENGCLGNSQNDVFSMVLIKLKTGHYIYFTYLSGQDIFRIRTKYLQTHMHPNCVVNLGKRGIYITSCFKLYIHNINFKHIKRRRDKNTYVKYRVM